MKNIYAAALKTLPSSDIDHHETDLYLKVSTESTELIKDYDYPLSVEKFVSPLDGCAWYCVYWAYTPGWTEKLDRSN